ncbi:hypothetical protein BDV23DRAFT_8594 [Aspergillus alliaceus]|uniref:Uncharacterized protein n=1 Tax=Petromyces alliaceus TaxID=209559 RepID=A0A5N7BW49_PETAA|nr:hypothetical protein BDV23DRAFT_8594 [Aspergillus alliaceus]
MNLTSHLLPTLPKLRIKFNPPLGAVSKYNYPSSQWKKIEYLCAGSQGIKRNTRYRGMHDNSHWFGLTFACRPSSRQAVIPSIQANHDSQKEGWNP